ncbi:hypothetical protein TIFTF001_018936 [Ficus carica]|uniref:Uncharacterized protein n=1 Tax=Ficus carica TaxID=3494 RepID=A0AA88AW53_FICCA|nr:hypothetical protein TIFTF001_018936 [Ficus carica]
MAKVVSCSGALFFILCHIFVLLSTQAVAQPFLYHFCLDEKGNYTTNSTYRANLNHLMTIFPSQEGNGYGFFNLSYGNPSNEVYAIALCRGDATPAACRSCLNNSTQLLPQICPNQSEAVIWYENCTLRYSNRPMLGIKESNSAVIWRRNGKNVTYDVDGFSGELRTLLDRLKNQAAAGGSLLKFATGNITAPAFKTIYALVQCTPDLSHQQCNNCLDDIYAVIQQCCVGKIGGRSGSRSCNFRYEINRFYAYAPATSPPPLAPTISPPSPTSANTTTTTGKESNTSGTVVIVVVSSTVALSAALIITIFVILRIKRAKQNIENEPVEEIESPESLQYNFETISIATDNFSEENKLGQGGFGSVYRGRLFNGQDIAVKRLSRGSDQGDLEFKNEVILVAKLQHRNLVRLLGFCLEGNERILVYEFVPNASLDHFIFDPSKRAHLDWERRYKIIGGIARGLLYLHEDSRLRIIHRDLKASNILLDEEMNPKISDFGMAKPFVVDQTQGNTSRIVGTYGYMAPEYVMHGQFSVKSDVFSFGVLLLEMVSGLKNNILGHGEHEEDLLSYAWRNWREGTTLNIADSLVRVGSGSEITRRIHIALLCVQESVAHRPTMNTVVLMLNSNSLSLPVPSKPAFFLHSRSNNFPLRTTGPDHSRSESVTEAYSANEASITELYPR